MVRRTWHESRVDGLQGWAAARTHYAVLASFPALLVMVAILGLLGQGTTNTLLDNVTSVAPGPARDIVTSAIQNLQDNRGTAGVLLIVGLAGALWTASGHVGAFCGRPTRRGSAG